MDNVKKTAITDCNTPSSEPFRLQLYLLVLFTGIHRKHDTTICRVVRHGWALCCRYDQGTGVPMPVLGVYLENALNPFPECKGPHTRWYQVAIQVAQLVNCNFTRLEIVGRKFLWQECWYPIYLYQFWYHLELLWVNVWKIKKLKRKWSKRRLTERKKYSDANLLKELDTNEPQDLRNYLRMNNKSFQNLLALIRPRIEKNNTFMRDAVAVAAPPLPSSPPGAWYRYLVAQCDCNLIRDTSPHTLQFASWYSVALRASQLVATRMGPLRDTKSVSLTKFCYNLQILWLNYQLLCHKLQVPVPANLSIKYS
jgi:hypothetical protein